MALRFHRRTKARTVKGVKTWANMSKTGASLSAQRGPITVNSRRGVTIKTPIKGLQFKFNPLKMFK